VVLVSLSFSSQVLDLFISTLIVTPPLDMPSPEDLRQALFINNKLPLPELDLPSPEGVKQAIISKPSLPDVVVNETVKMDNGLYWGYTKTQWALGVGSVVLGLAIIYYFMSTGDVLPLSGIGGTSPPPDLGGTSTPPDLGGTSTPSDLGGTSPPSDLGGTSPPSDLGGTTPPPKIVITPPCDITDDLSQLQDTIRPKPYLTFKASRVKNSNA
jgi:hypothetical protein